MVIDKVAGWVQADMQAGKDGNEALDEQTRDGIWHGDELYALDFFEGETPEAVRDYFRQEITNKVNAEGMRSGGRGFIFLRQPEELAQDTLEPTNDPVELLKRIQNADIQQTEIQSGTLTFSLGSQVTAEIKKGNYNTQKSAIVRFFVSDTATPIEKHYRGKALSPDQIVSTLSKQLTPFDLRVALGQPVESGGITYTPESFQIHTKSGMVDAQGMRLSGHKHEYAQLIAHREFQSNKDLSLIHI